MKKKINIINSTTLFVLVSLGVSIQDSIAQDDSNDFLPPVMVITESVNSDSSSVTVLSGETISIGGIQEVRDIQTALPNFSVFDANNTRMPKFSVRGLRENSYGAGQSAIGMYFDGVPYTDMLSRGLSLYDVDQIEFLRGPYDFIVTIEADSFETVAAVKMAVESQGVGTIDIFETVDINAIAEKAQTAMSNYTPPSE